jgi:hypothetical protein
MPLAGSEIYCHSANKNKDLISQAEKNIRDQREKIKQLELEIKQKKRLVKDQERNCSAVLKVDNSISLDIKPLSIFSGGKKSRKWGGSKKSRKNRKSRKMRK